MRIAKGLAQSDRKRLSKIIFSFQSVPHTHKNGTWKCGLVRVVWFRSPHATGRGQAPQVLPSHHGAYGREMEEVLAARNRRLPTPDTASRGRPEQPLALASGRAAHTVPMPASSLPENRGRRPHLQPKACDRPGQRSETTRGNAAPPWRRMQFSRLRGGQELGDRPGRPAGPLAPAQGLVGNVVLLLRDFGRLVWWTVFGSSLPAHSRVQGSGGHSFIYSLKAYIYCCSQLILVREYKDRLSFGLTDARLLQLLKIFV